jgi:hypothetical protein
MFPSSVSGSDEKHERVFDNHFIESGELCPSGFLSIVGDRKPDVRIRGDALICLRPAGYQSRSLAACPQACSPLHPGHIIGVENMVYFLYHTTGQSACAEWGEDEKISKETGSFQ